MKFHSPYQFIPVDTSKTPTYHWQERPDLEASANRFLRHDYWHAEGWSGRINCSFTCRSPMVVGGLQHQGSQEKPGTVDPYTQPDGTLAVPANSLRGMIASIVETISQSALRVLNEEAETVYSQRKHHTAALKDIGLMVKRDEGYFLYPLEARHYRVELDEKLLKDGATCYQHQHNKRLLRAQFVNSWAKNLDNAQKGEKQTGILYLRGKVKDKMPTKKNETFIPWDGQVDPTRLIPVDPDIVKRLEGILRDRHEDDPEFPQLPKGYNRPLGKPGATIVEDGDLIYYAQDNAGSVTELSYSAIWRKPVNGTLHQSFARSAGENSLPWHADRTGLTPAEQLFGVVEDKPPAHRPGRNLASRVRFTDALPRGPIALGDPITLKILASPKPPSPAMYFSAANGGYIPKQDLDLDQHAPNGRKHYLPQKAVTPAWQTGIEPNDIDHNWQPHLRVKPIPKDAQFSFEIHFENLAPEELSLLYLALQPATGFIHRLGLGKPLGLGQINLTVDSVERVERVRRYTPEGLFQPRYVACQPPLQRTLVDEGTLELLATLGHPDNLTDDPVCYPFTEDQGAYGESEGFEWFVANDALKQGNEYLDGVSTGQPIPRLKALKKRR